MKTGWEVKSEEIGTFQKAMKGLGIVGMQCSRTKTTDYDHKKEVLEKKGEKRQPKGE